MENRSLQDIVADSLRLSRHSRAFLAEKLLESLDLEDVFPVSDEWKAEAHRRIDEIENGSAQLIPAEEAFARVFRELKE